MLGNPMPDCGSDGTRSPPAQQLEEQRFLLDQDLQNYIQQAHRPLFRDCR
jgi:hypothetical protein